MLAVCFVSLAGCVTSRPVVTRHDLAVRLDPESNSLAAEDTLTLSTGGQSSLAFDLFENATVEKVATREKDLPFTLKGGTLRVALPPDLPEESELSLTVSYRASFRDHVPDDPVNTEDPSYGVRATIRDKGTFLSDSAGWYPEIPGSRPVFRIRVEGPAGYEAVTAGRLVRRETSGGRTRSTWETREPLEGLSLSAGPYRVRERNAGETKLYTYFYPGSDALSETYLAAAARYLALYRELFGPYPFGKFAVVENFFPTGYGFPSYTLLGSTVVRLPFIVETSLGHEVAHSWWGNGVLVDYQKGNWSEGLTTYVADYLYKERASPEEGREYRLKILRDYATLVTPGEDFPLRAFTGRDSPASRAVGYGKGAMVFHMARRLAGEEAFWKGMRDVVREKMFRKASWGDFGRAIGGRPEPISHPSLNSGSTVPEHRSSSLMESRQRTWGGAGGSRGGSYNKSRISISAYLCGWKPKGATWIPCLRLQAAPPLSLFPRTQDPKGLSSTPRWTCSAVSTLPRSPRP